MVMANPTKWAKSLSKKRFSKKRLLLLPVLLVIFKVTGFADEATTNIDTNADVKNRIKQIFANNPHTQIKPFDKHFYEINIGIKTFFASSDGRYIFTGPVIDTQTKQNISEQRAQLYRKERISNLDNNMTLSFPATGPKSHTVTLFTDIDCTFCRKLHSHMNEFNASGITFNYVMLPRAGRNSHSFNKTVSVLCSAQPQESMTQAMKGQSFEPNHCANTLSEQLALASELEINSTPTMILPDGQLRLGTITPSELLTLLNRKNS